MDKQSTIQSQNLIAKIVNSLPHYSFWKDINLVFQGCNLKFAKQFGYENETQVIGQTDRDFPWSKKHRSKYIKDDLFVIKTGRSLLNIEEKQIQPDGSVKHVLVSKVPLTGDDGNIAGVLGIYTDITERKKLEEKLAEAKIHEAHLKAMSAIGGMIAHELRTPLMTIALNASSIKDFFPILVKAYREYVKFTGKQEIREGYLDDLKIIAEDIEASANYANNTIDTILSGFRYTDSRSVPTETIEVNTIIRRALSDYPLNEKEKTLINFQPTGEYRALAVANIVIHVIHNLLKNALYAIQSANKGMITISVDKTNDGDIRIQFRDTAKGISKEIREHIFDPFYTTKDTKTSIGLGLYFCKIALEKMNASITCESKEGAYTLFTIILKGLSSEAK